MRIRGWARLLGGAAILAVVIWRLGTGPFVDGLRTINAGSLSSAAGIGVVTTVCAAWRWRLVAGGLGVGVSPGAAVAAYYRAQFLNTALPGGVLGDVHRAVRHGTDVGDVGKGARAVAWERAAGQVVQVCVALGVLALMPSPVRPAMHVVLPAALLVALAVTVLVRMLPRDGPSRPARALRTAVADVREGLLARRAWPGIALASLVAVAGYLAIFLIAAETAGSRASLVRLVPLAMLVLLAMAVPTNIGGWGPREGVAAWSFGAAGLGAGQGVATATVYGVLVMAATLPGAAVLFAPRLARTRRREEPVHG
jgi:glycosyltransferase 2 family protein